MVFLFQITAKITAAITKPIHRHTPAPGKAQQAEEALAAMVDFVEDYTKGAVDAEVVKSRNPEKPVVNDLASKLRELGLKNLDDMLKS